MDRSYDTLWKNNEGIVHFTEMTKDLKREIIIHHLLNNTTDFSDKVLNIKVHYYPVTEDYSDEKYIFSCSGEILKDFLYTIFEDSHVDVNFNWLNEYSTNNQKLVHKSNYDKYVEFHDKLNNSIKLSDDHTDHWKKFQPFELTDDYECGYAYKDKVWEITIFHDTNIKIIPIWYFDKVTYVVEVLIDFFSDDIPLIRTIVNNFDLEINIRIRD